MPNCDYLATDYRNNNWVRFEYCYVVNGGIVIGARNEVRQIVSTDQGKCRDSDNKTHIRYKIGDKEWICIIP